MPEDELRRLGSRWPSPWLIGAVLLMFAIAILLVVDLSRSDPGHQTQSSGTDRRPVVEGHTASIRLVGIDLKSQRLFDVMASGADMSAANLANAHMIGAQLAGVLLYGACLRGTVLIGANLSHAHLDGADVRGADFTGANLDQTDFAGAVYDDATQWPDGQPPRGAILDPNTAFSC